MSRRVLSSAYRAAALLLLAALAGAVQAAPTNYTLDDGDVVRVTVYNQPDLTLETQISPDGQISFPLLGPIRLAGLTYTQAEKLIGEQLEIGGFVRGANVNVLITQYRSRRLAVLGEVNRPTRLALDSATSLYDALALAGGVAASGGDKVIVLRAPRNGEQERLEFRLSDLVNRKASNVMVAGGDVVFVPKGEQFYVYGEVQRPGVFRLDRPTNVMQALSASGGFNTRADTRRLLVYRQQDDGSTREFELKPTDAMHDVDVLFIKESLF